MSWCIVDGLPDGKMSHPVSHVADIQQELIRQRALHAERPALRVGRLHVGIEKRDGLPESRRQTSGSSGRRDQTVWKRIRQRSHIGLAVVLRRLNRRALREARLNW